MDDYNYNLFYPGNSQSIPGPSGYNQSMDAWVLAQRQYQQPFGRNTAMPPPPPNFYNNYNRVNGYNGYNRHNRYYDRSQKNESNDKGYEYNENESTYQMGPNIYHEPREQNDFNRHNGFNEHSFNQRQRFNNSSYTHRRGSRRNYNQGRHYQKRPRPQDSSDLNEEPKLRPLKKKKKSLAQIVRTKDWTQEEAEMAIAVEKEYNKQLKKHSLIIKFPDHELNRDIVSNFHPSIKNVHFQHPCTPRYCFVNVDDEANVDEVIQELNKIRFGEGFLTAEYKKDRDEDHNVTADDIDPCVLFVGNISLEVAKEDILKMFPKLRRVDIGFSKKMKSTRYAFVTYHSVIDAIESFKETHGAELYSKSLIVRFRRLHGTIGMPSERNFEAAIEDTSNSNRSQHRQTDVFGNTSESPDLQTAVIKQEVDSSDDEIIESYESPFMEGSINLAFEKHQPIVKKEIKQETDNGNLNHNDTGTIITSPPSENDAATHKVSVEIKQETLNNYESRVHVKDEQDDQDELDEEPRGDLNFSNLVTQLESHAKQIDNLRMSAP